MRCERFAGFWKWRIAPSPVMASMRRTPAEMLLSETILNTPMSPVRVTCVPPHSSLLKSGMETTRTCSPYFSPNKRHRAGGNGLVDRHHIGGDLRVAEDLLVDEPLDFEDFGGIERGVMGEIEAKPRGLDHAAGLLDVRSENLAQGGVQQVSRGVVAHGRPAFGDADFGAQFVANTELAERADLVDGEAGNSGARVFHDGYDLAGMCAVKRSAIADLTAGFGVERRLIENDLGFDTGGEAVDKLLIY